MPTNVAGLADSHYVWKISTDGGTTLVKVDHLLKLDPVKREKTTDDVTPTDAKNTHTATVDFTEATDIAFELALNPTNPEHISLEAAFNDNSEIINEIHFVNTAVTGFKFSAQVSKFEYDSSDVKKKIRIMGQLTISGDITRLTSAP